VSHVEAIKQGDGSLDPLLASLKREGSRKKDLLAELDRLERLTPSTLDVETLIREMKARLADLPALLSTHVETGHDILRKLFKEPIRWTAVREGENSRYEINATGNLMNLLRENAAPLGWCPQRVPHAWGHLNFVGLRRRHSLAEIGLRMVG
jgi:hypothetical protein